MALRPHLAMGSLCREGVSAANLSVTHGGYRSVVSGPGSPDKDWVKIMNGIVSGMYARGNVPWGGLAGTPDQSEVRFCVGPSGEISQR